MSLPISSESKSLSLFLTQLDKVFFGTPYFPATSMFKFEKQTKNKQMIVYINVRIHNINKIERAIIRTFKTNCECHKLRILAKKKDVRHEFFDRRRIANNLTKRVWLNSNIKGYHAYMLK